MRFKFPFISDSDVKWVQKNNNHPHVEIWGSGAAQREFLYVDDLAQACIFLMNLEAPPGLVNIGTGQDISILELAKLIQRITGYTGDLQFDRSKPDGTPRKLLDISKLRALGFTPKITLQAGIQSTYEHFVNAQYPALSGA